MKFLKIFGRRGHRKEEMSAPCSVPIASQSHYTLARSNRPENSMSWVSLHNTVTPRSSSETSPLSCTSESTLNSLPASYSSHSLTLPQTPPPFRNVRRKPLPKIVSREVLRDFYNSQEPANIFSIQAFQPDPSNIPEDVYTDEEPEDDEEQWGRNMIEMFKEVNSIHDSLPDDAFFGHALLKELEAATADNRFIADVAEESGSSSSSERSADDTVEADPSDDSTDEACVASETPENNGAWEGTLRSTLFSARSTSSLLIRRKSKHRKTNSSPVLPDPSASPCPSSWSRKQRFMASFHNLLHMAPPT